MGFLTINKVDRHETLSRGALRVMPSHSGARGAASRSARPAACVRACCGSSQRVVLSLQFPGIAGITFDTSGDVFVSYNSTLCSRNNSSPSPRSMPNGNLVNAAVFTTTGAAALPAC